MGSGDRADVEIMGIVAYGHVGEGGGGAVGSGDRADVEMVGNVAYGHVGKGGGGAVGSEDRTDVEMVAVGSGDRAGMEMVVVGNGDRADVVGEERGMRMARSEMKAKATGAYLHYISTWPIIIV